MSRLIPLLLLVGCATSTEVDTREHFTGYRIVQDFERGPLVQACESSTMAFNDDGTLTITLLDGTCEITVSPAVDVEVLQAAPSTCFMNARASLSLTPDGYDLLIDGMLDYRRVIYVGYMGRVEP